MREIWVRSLGWEDPLEKGMAIHSSTLAWRIPWTVQSMWLQRVGHDWMTFTLKDTFCMKCSLVISKFLEEISSLSHSIVFLYLFILIAEEGFLISPCYSLELCIQMGVSSLFSPLAYLLFSAVCKASSDNHFAFLHFFFLGIVLITASCTVQYKSVLFCPETLSIVFQALYQI